MSPQNLQDVVADSPNLVERFRTADIDQGTVHWNVYQEEHTNWIEEQRAWQENCILMDQSYHLANYYIEGPDALQVNADVGLHDFTKLQGEDTPSAKQHPVCSPEGGIIGDPILFHLGEDQVAVTGNRGLAQKWIQYTIETGDYDVRLSDIYSPYGERPPVEFRFEIQGPYADTVLSSVIDGDMPELSFFGMDRITIDGTDLYVLGHGMASVPGYEIFGPHERHNEIKALLLGAGEDYGIRELGSKAYKTATLTTGWLPTGLPAVYSSEEMTGYRKWLDTDCIEANWSLGGSYKAEDISDYYLDPVSLGYQNFIDLDHQFVGKAAIEERMSDPARKKVTFLWNADDVVKVYSSLFGAGEQYKFIQLPDVAQRWDMGHYDRVERNGELVGLSLFAGYDANERKMLSLGVIDLDYSKPGSEVTIIWGEEDSPKSKVERHDEVGIGATVAPAPLVAGRESM